MCEDHEVPSWDTQYYLRLHPCRLIFFLWHKITVYATDIGSGAGESRWGDSRGRENARSEQTTGEADGEEAAGARNGREARPFFDPKRGQLGAKFSGGTGLTRPLGILIGTHTVAGQTISPRRPRATRWYHHGSGAAPASPRRQRISRLNVATEPRTINIEGTLPRESRQSAIIKDRISFNDVAWIQYLRVVRKCVSK